MADSCPVSYRTINQYGVRTAFAATIARFMAHALNTLYCIGGMGTTVNLNTIGCVWTGEFDLNTLRVEEEIFESGKENVGDRFKNIPVYVDRA